MRKVVTTISLAILLAALGCTTNNNPGDGQPMNAPAMMPSSTPGSSSGSTITPPMASSFATPMTPSQRAAAAVDAVAVLAADQGYRGRILGAANPAPIAQSANTANAAPAIAQPVNPAPLVNPETTVNSTISSPATPAITGDASGGGAVVLAAPATVGAVTAVATPATTATTANATMSGVAAGATTATVHSQGAITAASATVPIAGSMSQTALPTAIATAPAATTAGTAATTTNATTTTRATTAAVQVAPSRTATASGELALPGRSAALKANTSTASRAPIQILTDSSGTIMMTNVASTNTQKQQ